MHTMVLKIVQCGDIKDGFFQEERTYTVSIQFVDRFNKNHILGSMFCKQNMHFQFILSMPNLLLLWSFWNERERQSDRYTNWQNDREREANYSIR